MHFVKHVRLPVILPLPLTTLSVISVLVAPLVANSYSSPTRPSLGYHKGIKSMASTLQTSPPLPSPPLPSTPLHSPPQNTHPKNPQAKPKTTSLFPNHSLQKRENTKLMNQKSTKIQK